MPMDMEETNPDVIIHLDIDPRINFAMQQNDVPVVKRLQIENRSEVVLVDVKVRITTDPPFADEWSTHLSRLGPESKAEINKVDLNLSPQYLSELTERLDGRLVASVSSTQGVMAQATRQVSLLARDEWAGLRSLPELLAAFVVPNNPSVDQLAKSASSFLGEWSGDPALGGYQVKDRKRVGMTAAAVYAALAKSGVAYASPPASFEEHGQRVRLPNRIRESQLATCLDLALYSAACFEQAGLGPLVMLVEGHAFVGVWLDDQTFSESVVQDCVRVRKRVELSEMVVFDPSCAVASPQRPWDQSVAEATRRLENAERFLCALDVRRARKAQVRPLPEWDGRFARTPESASEAAQGLGIAGECPPDLTGVLPAEPDEPREPVETATSRLDRWQRKLLDLSLRNRLLNFKSSKKTVRLQCPDEGLLEDMLADGAAFEVHPKPACRRSCKTA